MEDAAARFPVAERVHEATLLIARETGCTMVEARGLIYARARATGGALQEVALDVLNGVVRLRPDESP